MRLSLTMVALLGLLVVLADAQAPTAPQKPAKAEDQKSPSEVAHRFVRLESKLLPDHWNQLSDFFVNTPKPQWNKVHIVDVVHVSTETKGSSSRVTISTNSMGELDSALRLSDYPPMRLPLVVPSTSACYGDDYFEFGLVLSGRHSVLTQKAEALAWRIEDTSFEPLITLDTAMKYVTQTGEKTESSVKRNAKKTLRILEYFRQGKPLPDELSTGATGGCG
jgi:hypothetical protein